MDINQTSQQFIKALTDDFLNSVTNQIRNQVTTNVTRTITDFDIKTEIHQRVKDAVANAVNYYHWPNDLAGPNTPSEDSVVVGVVAEFKSQTDLFLKKLVIAIETQIIQDMRDKISALDVNTLVQQQVSGIVNSRLDRLNFPVHSIPGSAVHPESLTVSANNITPGRIAHFESTGIQDKATDCQVTIMDVATVFENKLVSRDLEIAGDAVFTGNVRIENELPETSKLFNQILQAVLGRIKSEYSDGTYDNFVDRVISKLNTDGIDAPMVKVGGSPLIEQDGLATSIVNSNLQRVGALRELQVVGETLLDETLYVSNKRLGLNTLEPERTLDIWDQEVQIVAGKRSKDVAYIGTSRPQALILGAANRDQLTVNPDGTVSIARLNMGRLSHSSAAVQPTDNRPQGHIVWNENPQVGSAIGWVSLGGARWARFGTITE